MSWGRVGHPSEIVGIGAEWEDDYRARGVRRDPLEVRAAVKVLKAVDKSWTVADAKAKSRGEILTASLRARP
jgi:hypothetical protein